MVDERRKNALVDLALQETQMGSSSGPRVQFDGAGNILVGDAKNNRVQLFDETGALLCVLILNRGTPFVSDIQLTLDGRLLVMSRHKHVVHVYQLE